MIGNGNTMEIENQENHHLVKEPFSVVKGKNY